MYQSTAFHSVLWVVFTELLRERDQSIVAQITQGRCRHDQGKVGTSFCQSHWFVPEQLAENRFDLFRIIRHHQDIVIKNSLLLQGGTSPVMYHSWFITRLISTNLGLDSQVPLKSKSKSACFLVFHQVRSCQRKNTFWWAPKTPASASIQALMLAEQTPKDDKDGSDLELDPAETTRRRHFVWQCRCGGILYH